MISISCRRQKYTYNVYHLVKAFYPGEEITQAVDEEQEPLLQLELPGGACFSFSGKETAPAPAPAEISQTLSKGIQAEKTSAADAAAEGMRPGKIPSKGIQAEKTPAADAVAKGMRPEKIPPKDVQPAEILPEEASPAEEARSEKVKNITVLTEVPRDSSEEDRRQRTKRALTRALYEELSAYTGKTLAWGTLTGVRPTKLVMKDLETGKTKEQIRAHLQGEYAVTDGKASLAYETAVQEKRLLDKLDAKKGFSLYIGIPFCPSICSYCSFGSAPVEQWKTQTDAYVSSLIREIEMLGRLAEGRYPDTIYIGGGTPTALGALQLDRLLDAISKTFDLEGALEYTVEAGRPDSITREKLSVLKSYPVSRISVNPQTMQQKTLDLVGRRHTPEDVVRAFTLAREMGFADINMDLIAGLPQETAADMADTLSQIERLSPDSLTVHALAIKRAAQYGKEKKTAVQGPEITAMIELAGKRARGMGMHPYYLYRQKNIAGNFENVGYAKVDKEGIYNILIMEEKQTILAAGCGAITKVLLPKPICKEGGKRVDLVRIQNVKNIREYIDRIDEIAEKKARTVRELWKAV